MHTHSDVTLIYDRKASSMVYEGVTSNVIGNCGIGVAPISEDRKADLISYLSTRLIGTIPVKLELPWNSFSEYLAVLENNPPAINAIPLVSQGAIRINEMGFAKEKPTPEQLSNMKAEIKKCLDDGCAGLSSGLVYLPGEYSDADELAQLAKEVVPYDSFYVTHIRNEGSNCFAALDEAIETAKKAGSALHISHLKMMGADMWGKTDELFGKIDAAKAKGMDITFDAYPYTKGCTSLGACMPPWTFEGGTPNMLERIKDPDIRKRIIKEIEEGIPGWQNFIKTCGSWDRIIFANTNTEEGKKLLGKSIAQACEEQGGKDPYEFVFDTLIQESGRIQILAHSMDDKDVDTIICHPDTIIGSDGMNLSMEGILGTGSPHPRSFGTHGRMLSYYVRERGFLTFEQAIAKMTSKPAARLRIKDRGALKEGYFADVVMFDPENVKDMATFESPKQYTKGIEAVIVNGEIALENGVQTDVTSGRVIRVR